MLLGVLLASPAWGFEGRYEVQGVGPEGSYTGAAAVEREADRLTVTLKSLDSLGRERLAQATARVVDGSLRFVSRAVCETEREAPLRVLVRALDGDPTGLVATYVDAQRQVVRRECWVRTARVEVPLQLVTLVGRDGRFPGVGSAQAREAQAWILAQLEAVFGPQQIGFCAVSPEPVELDGARFDRDHDGRLSADEARDLRDALEALGLKRRGRVVLVVTAAELTEHGCRGWTLGDMPPTPETLDDLNDNVSLVGLRYLDPSQFHTVAHEVGHQLGLDDLNPRNRELLRDASRRDHLMYSGGTGLFLDAVVIRMLRRTVGQFPHHGLEGRAGNPAIGSGLRLDALDRQPEGLPQPSLSR